MYKCQICQQTVPAGTKAHRIVVETRRRTYIERKEANRLREDGRVKYRNDPGGEGYETVREITACPTCASIYKESHG